MKRKWLFVPVWLQFAEGILFCVLRTPWQTGSLLNLWWAGDNLGLQVLGWSDFDKESDPTWCLLSVDARGLMLFGRWVYITRPGAEETNDA